MEKTLYEMVQDSHKETLEMLEELIEKENDLEELEKLHKVREEIHSRLERMGKSLQ